MNSHSKILVIGLDGATWDVLNPWISDGTLPNLARLRQTGCWGNLRSTIPPLTSPAWTSFMTGKNPGKHGILHFISQEAINHKSDSQPELVNGRNIKSSTLWDILSHHDLKVGVINLPMTYPPRPVNGFLISGFLTPPGASNFTYPDSLSGKLNDYQIDLDRFISRKPFENVANKAGVEPSMELVRDLYNLMELRARTGLSLMESEPWDVFMCVFMGTDRLGHYMWPYHRAVDLDGSEESLELHKAIHDYYIRLDEFIGEFIHKAGEETTLIVVSDHGMGSFPTKRVHLNFWLREQKLVSARGHNLTNMDSWLTRLGVSRNRLGQIILNIPILNNKRLTKRLRETKAPPTDIEGSIAYYKRIYGQTGFIHINLSKDDPEYEELRHHLMQKIQDIVDSETGEPVVQFVYKGEEYYSGPYLAKMPAIVVVLHPEYEGTDRLSNYSSIVTKSGATMNPGDHKMEGILIIAGSSIQSNPEPLTDVSLMDITPTILHLLGMPVPSDLDGRVISEVVVQGSEIDHPVEYTAPIGFWEGPDGYQQVDEELTSDDEAQIRERLAALGYLE